MMRRRLAVFLLAIITGLVTAGFAAAQGTVPDVSARGMSELDAVNFIVGFLMPLLIAFVQQPYFPPGARAVLALLLCVAAGVATVWATHGLHLDDRHFVVSVAEIFIAAQVAYDRFWKQTGLAPWIEAKTTFTRPPEAPAGR